jgi:hypothetical protein
MLTLWVRQAYREATWERLVAIKARYDVITSSGSTRTSR